MRREESNFYEPLVAVARSMRAELPPPVCTECLVSWREAVDTRRRRVSTRDQALYRQFRAGEISREECLAAVSDPALYARCVEAVVEQNAKVRAGGKSRAV